MENIVNYLGAGKIYKYPNTPAVCLTIVKFTICNIIIPFFNKNPIFGVKIEDYLYFKILISALCGAAVSLNYLIS
jgi:hypothetical protein